MIRSKIHRVLDLVRKDEVYVMKPESYQPGLPNWSLDHWGAYRPERVYMEMVIGKWMKRPVFVVDDSIGKMLHDKFDGMYESICDLKEADMLQLPAQHMVVEFDNQRRAGDLNHVTTVVMLTDLRAEGIREEIAKEIPDMDSDIKELIMDTDFDCIARVMYVVREQDGTEYVVGNTAHVMFGLVRKPDGIQAKVSSILDLAVCADTKFDNSEIEHKSAVQSVAYAYICASLVYYTQGIEREEIKCERLNRKRKAKGESAIPDHVYIYIGRIYRSTGEVSEKYDVRRSPRPHWRRPHVRGVRFGPGRKDVRMIKIPGRIVAWDGTGPEPVPDARTHVIKVAKRGDRGLKPGS